jgi:hypothetical protein
LATSSAALRGAWTATPTRSSFSRGTAATAARFSSSPPVANRSAVRLLGVTPGAFGSWAENALSSLSAMRQPSLTVTSGHTR